MSVTTLPPAPFDDFDAWEAELAEDRPRRRPSRGVARLDAIRTSQGHGRRRKYEREV